MPTSIPAVVRVADLVVRGYFSPTPLLCLWGPWINKLNLVSKN